MSLDVGSHTPPPEVLDSFGPKWSLCEPELIREGLRARVYRCRSAAPGRESVILKQITDSAALGFNDWASLEFLGQLSAAGGITPRFLTGSVEQRSYLIEDLGGSCSLETLLNEPNRDEVVTSFEALASAYGKLHMATRGGEGQYLQVRAWYPGLESQGRAAETARWLQGRSKIDAWLTALELNPLAGLDDALQSVAATYADARPFHTFTHGDPAPTNNHVRGGVVRLLDFEYGAMRHALYDLTAWEILCPLPCEVVEVMQQAWKRECAGAWPEAVDEELFRQGWAAMCAFRALAMLSWITPDVLKRNRPWVGDWTALEAISTAISRLARACAGVQELASVRHLAENVEGALLRRFPELEGALPRWPAFSCGGVAGS